MKIQRQASRVRLKEYLARQLEERGLRASELAEKAGISASHFSQVLDGKKGLSESRVIALANALVMPATEMLELAGMSSPVLDASEFLLTRSARRQTVQVVTDPRFFDSALFAWLMSMQPLAMFGIETEVIASDWDAVPAKIDDFGGIGFYNRKVVSRRGQSVMRWKVERWTDLCMYTGYAVLTQPGEISGDQLPTLAEANAYLNKLKKRNGRRGKPTIVSFGGDVRWGIFTPLTPTLNFENFEPILVPSADQALEKFGEHQGDLFVGGLPQRLAAIDQGLGCELLTFENNPLFFTLNSLIAAEAFLGRPNSRAILTAVEALWFGMIDRLKRDEAFRETACEAIPRAIDGLGVKKHNITTSNLRRTLPGPHNRDNYELFPSRPTDLMTAVVRTVQRAMTSTSRSKNTQVGSVLDRIADELLDEPDNESPLKNH